MEVKELKPSELDTLLRRWNINPDLLMLKVTLFVMYGATASLLPYLTLHMQSIGLTVEEMAMVYVALPLTTFLSPPLTGFLVDKFGWFKPVVVASLLVNAVCHHALLLIPPTETPGTTPPAYVMRHPRTGKVEVWWSPCPSRECPEEEELDMVLATCADHCLLKEDLPQPSSPPPLPLLCPHLQDLGQGGGQAQEVTQKPLHFIMGLDAKSSKKKNNRKGRGKAKLATGLGGPQDTNRTSAFLLLKMHPDLGEPLEHLGLELEPEDNETTSLFLQSFGEDVLYEAKVNVSALLEEDLRCGGLVLATNLTMATLVQLTEDCMLQKCGFRDGGPPRCPPGYKESDDRTFWVYFWLRFFGTVALTAGVTALDPAALSLIRKHGGHFGRERLFSALGMALASPLVGLLIDRDSRQRGYTDYSAAFYAYDALLLVAAMAVAALPLADHHHQPADSILRGLVSVVRMPHVSLFIAFLFLLGNFWGFIESFLFLYLKELGAPNYLLGFTVTVGTISSVPFLYGAADIIKKVGHVNIIILAFFSHAARLVGYSLIESPWWCFPFEALEALAVHLMWIAAATYCAVLAPKTLLATLIGVLGMSHFSLGRGSGSFVGGLLIGTHGTRESFRLMGVLAVVGGGAYWLLHRYWLHTLHRETQELARAVAEAFSPVVELNHRGSLAAPATLPPLPPEEVDVEADAVVPAEPQFVPVSVPLELIRALGDETRNALLRDILLQSSTPLTSGSANHQ